MWWCCLGDQIKYNVTLAIQSSVLRLCASVKRMMTAVHGQFISIHERMTCFFMEKTNNCVWLLISVRETDGVDILYILSIKQYNM